MPTTHASVVFWLDLTPIQVPFTSQSRKKKKHSETRAFNIINGCCFTQRTTFKFSMSLFFLPFHINMIALKKKKSVSEDKIPILASFPRAQ